MTQAQDDLTRLRAAAQALVATLPQCREPGCDALATHTVDVEATLCPVHAQAHVAAWPDLWREHQRTGPLRDLLALLGGE